MRRRPRKTTRPIFRLRRFRSTQQDLGIVLSGGGTRAAYQVGALKALSNFIDRNDDRITVIVGTSIGAVNGIILGACMNEGLGVAVKELQSLWQNRTYRTTFANSPSTAFFRAIKVAAMQSLAPGPDPTDEAIFDPTPLVNTINEKMEKHGGLSLDSRHPDLRAVAVMTTVEGSERKPLLFLNAHREDVDEEAFEGASFDISHVDTMTAEHGMASAALPSILPPVELDLEHKGALRLVDGGISQNVPVDPAVRLGAERVALIDVSGRDWWLQTYNEAPDSRPTWEVEAGLKTYCARPPDTLVLRSQKPFGPLLKEAVGKSTQKFMRSIGPIWPLFQLLKRKLGEEVAYETVSYAALDPDYIHGMIERGYNETIARLRTKTRLEFQHSDSYQNWEKILSD